MALRLLLLIVFCTTLYGTACTQHFKYKHFDVDDGLPSSQVFCAFQDDEGYMWFTTDNGLSRFNGYQFDNYSTKDGIADNTILKGQKAKDNSLLFFTLSSGFFWFKQGKFHPILSKDYLKLMQYQKLKIREYVLDKNKTIWFSTNEHAIYYSLDTNGKLLKYKCEIPQKTEKRATFLVQVDSNSILPVAIFRDIKKDFTSFQIINKKHHYFIPNVEIKLAIKLQNLFILLTAGDEQSKGKLFLYHPKNRSLKKLPEEKGKYYNIAMHDAEDNLWLGHKKGVDFYKGNNPVPIQLLSNVYVTHLFQDFEKNIWVTTKDNGVYLITDLNIKNYLKNEKIVSFSDYNQKLWVTTVNGKVFRKDSLHRFVKLFDKKVENIVNASHFSKNGVFFYDGIYDFSGVKKSNFKKGKTINAKKVISVGDSIYITSTHNGLVYLNIRTGFSKWRVGPKLRINALFKDTSNTILLGSVKGLFSFNFSKLSYADIRNGKQLLSQRIMDIEKWGNSYALATRGQGVVIYSKDTLFAITKEAGLKSNLVSCITTVNDSVIWVGSNNGVARIELEPFTLKIKSISNYTNVEGLTSNEVLDIIYYKNSIWVGTSKGVSLLPTGIRNTFAIPPKLKISQVYINNKPQGFAKHLHLKPHQNNININYLGISFKTLGKLTFRYRLKGYLNEWTETESKNVNFTNIPAGSYTFELQVQNKNGIWSSSKTVHFTIAKHFTQEVWFIALMVFLIVSIPSGIVLVYSKNRRRREKQKRRVLEAQLLALRNQINPHFIFNALNSIQAYNVKARDKEAIKYLSNFSELMRQILENTKHRFISLYDEISCVKNYLKLEALRTNNRFSYTITINNELEGLHVYLPPMLLQPHLENAIWKGFTGEIQNPQLHIEFSKYGNALHIKIRDNGIGINKSKIINSKIKKTNGYESTGIRNIQERIKSIRELYGIFISIKIQDVSEKNADQIGTEVLYTITLLTELAHSI